MATTINLRQSIRVAIATNGLKAYELAKKAGINKAYLSDISKKNRCGTKILERLAAAVDLSVSEFLKLGES